MLSSIAYKKSSPWGAFLLSFLYCHSEGTSTLVILRELPLFVILRERSDRRILFRFFAALRMTRGNGAPGEAQRSGFAGVKEEGGSIAPFSPKAETERCELLLTPSFRGSETTVGIRNTQGVKGNGLPRRYAPRNDKGNLYLCHSERSGVE